MYGLTRVRAVVCARTWLITAATAWPVHDWPSCLYTKRGPPARWSIVRAGPRAVAGTRGRARRTDRDGIGLEGVAARHLDRSGRDGLWHRAVLRRRRRSAPSVRSAGRPVERVKVVRFRTRDAVAVRGHRPARQRRRRARRHAERQVAGGDRRVVALLERRAVVGHARDAVRVGRHDRARSVTAWRQRREECRLGSRLDGWGTLAICKPARPGHSATAFWANRPNATTA